MAEYPSQNDVRNRNFRSPLNPSITALTYITDEVFTNDDVIDSLSHTDIHRWQK